MSDAALVRKRENKKSIYVHRPATGWVRSGDESGLEGHAKLCSCGEKHAHKAQKATRNNTPQRAFDPHAWQHYS